MTVSEIGIVSFACNSRNSNATDGAHNSLCMHTHVWLTGSNFTLLLTFDKSFCLIATLRFGQTTLSF